MTSGDEQPMTPPLPREPGDVAPHSQNAPRKSVPVRLAVSNPKRPNAYVLIERSLLVVDASKNCRNYGRPIDPESEDVRELAQSIEDEGLLEPVVVQVDPSWHRNTGRPTDKPRYQLIGGYRRIAACDCIGMTLIPATVRDHTSAPDAFAASIVENVQRVQLSPAETAYAVARLRDEYRKAGNPITGAALARKIGKHPSLVSKYLLAVDCLIPEIAAAWRGEKGPPLDQNRVFAWAALRPEQQKRAYDEYLGKVDDATAARRRGGLMRPAPRALIETLRKELKLATRVRLGKNMKAITSRDRLVVARVLDWVLDRSKPYPLDVPEGDE